MPYESVDTLQNALTQDVFHYARDAKKAAGRALGTVVEIIAFYSYGKQTHGNVFTKVLIDLAADAAIQRYFSEHREVIDSWFNVVSPTGRTMREFRREVTTLAKKNWKDMLA